MHMADSMHQINQNNEKVKKFVTYFTPDEVVLHDHKDDIWVSYLGRVYNMTPLVKEFEGQDVIKPILAHAGKDITEWFQPDNTELREHIHPVTWCRAPCKNHGELPHLGPIAPSVSWKLLTKVPWWKNSKYMVGYLTECPRFVRIVNVLTGHVDCIQVCSEDTLNRIQERFMEKNGHIGSYTWKSEGRLLDMNLNLEQNGFPDETKEFQKLQLPLNLAIPNILIYYNDDLTEF